MSIVNGVRKSVIAGLVVGLAMAPALSAKPFARAVNFMAAATQEPNAFADQESEQDRKEREQEAREREQEKRDEAREREQEKKDREQERLDRMQELYDDGREALDDEKYQQAAEKFGEFVKMNGPQTDAGLYWKAYAENRQGKRDTALATLAELNRRYPQSRWKRDGDALNIEIRQSSGHPVNPESQSDEELKTLALQGVMNADPQRGVQIIEKRLAGAASPKEKAKMLFVLAQNGSPEARAVLAKVARGESNPELQRKSVEYLGIFGGARAGDELASIYSSTNDAGVKRAVMLAREDERGDKRLVAYLVAQPDQILRPDDLLNLRIDGVNLRLDAQNAQSPALVIENATSAEVKSRPSLHLTPERSRNV